MPEQYHRRRHESDGCRSTKVASALGKAWSGFPTLLTAIQLGAGLAMMLPVIFSMATMLVVVCAWVSTERLPKQRVC